MSLQVALPTDASLIGRLWTNADWAEHIDPPAPDQIGAAIAAGLAFVWRPETEVLGFAVLTQWHDGVYGLAALVATRKGVGRPLMHSVLAHVFGPLNAHRISLDVTADNTRALRFFAATGFQAEGVLRECWRRPSGTWVDCVFMGLLAREWQP